MYWKISAAMGSAPPSVFAAALTKV